MPATWTSPASCSTAARVAERTIAPGRRGRSPAQRTINGIWARAGRPGPFPGRHRPQGRLGGPNPRSDITRSGARALSPAGTVPWSDLGVSQVGRGGTVKAGHEEVEKTAMDVQADQTGLQPEHATIVFERPDSSDPDTRSSGAPGHALCRHRPDSGGVAPIETTPPEFGRPRPAHHGGHRRRHRAPGGGRAGLGQGRGDQLQLDRADQQGPGAHDNDAPGQQAPADADVDQRHVGQLHHPDLGLLGDRLHLDRTVLGQHRARRVSAQRSKGF